jgi:hypothetical protein
MIRATDIITNRQVQRMKIKRTRRDSRALVESLENRELLSAVTLDFNGGGGGVADTGFTDVLATSYGKGLISADLVQTGGKLLVTTTAGDFYGTRNTQDDALYLPVDGTRDFVAQTRITSFNFTKNWQDAGLFVGTSQDNYVKLVVGYNYGTGLEMASETDATFKDVKISNMSLAGARTLDLRLIGDAATKTVVAQYRLNSDDDTAWVTLGQTTNAKAFGADGKAGIVSTNYATTAVTVAYDSFGVTQPDPLPPPPPPPSSGTLTVGSNVNATKMTGNQAEAEVAINPTNPNNLVIVANNLNNNASQLLISRSTDGGLTWQTSALGGAQDHYSSTTPRVDPHAAFDAFGNLYVAYEVASSSTEIRVVVARSGDGGQTFTATTAVSGLGLNVDFPMLATGVDATDASRQTVWVAFMDTKAKRVKIVGARSTGLGNLGAFGAPTTVSDAPGGFGSIAVGPQGQVVVGWQSNTNNQKAGTMYVDVDPDGLGAAATWGADRLIGSTNVGGVDYIAAQPDRSIDANVGVAFDLSDGPARGRLYVVYTDERKNESDDTDVMLRYSDDLGASWSDALKVNDDTTRRSQFLPAMAVDPTTGNVAIVWRDARDSATNTAVETYAAVSTDHGLSFGANVRLSEGPSDQAGADGHGAAFDLDFGDYGGVAFYGGRLVPVWADNSGATADNPDGAGSAFDLYTVVVAIA